MRQRRLDELRMRRNVHLTLNNRFGSVQHYYHFLLGFLLPLMHALEDLDADPDTEAVFVRSCGPMDRLLLELDSRKLRIIDPDLHRDPEKLQALLSLPELQRRSIEGFDSLTEFDPQPIVQAATAVRARLGASTRPGPSTPSGIVLIQRSLNPFYKSPQSEIRCNGTERRSIPNFDELRDALEAGFGPVETVILEDASLARQIDLFGGAGIVVAQHGAALGNMVWMDPRATVVEIFPPDCPNCFMGLARALGLGFEQVLQNHPHGACDIPAIVSRVEKHLNT